MVHASRLVAQDLPHEGHGAKKLCVIGIERTHRHIAARIGTRHVFGTALSRLRPFAPDR